MHIIHRGIVNKSYKENCLKSFRASFKKRFGIETDIHSTKDKKFVCFHDFTLKRIFKINKSIKSIIRDFVYFETNKLEVELNQSTYFRICDKCHNWIVFSAEWHASLETLVNYDKNNLFLALRKMTVHVIVSNEWACSIGTSQQEILTPGELIDAARISKQKNSKSYR